MTHGGMLLTGSLVHSLGDTYVYPKTTCLGMVLLTVGWTLLHHFIKIIFLSAMSTGQSDLEDSSVEVFLLHDLRLCYKDSQS